MKAALLFGPQDLRIEHIPDPQPLAGQVTVRVEAATACGTDVKMWRHGHRILPAYPCRFGHETAGVRVDTGERVLVSDSVACGACPPCRAGRPQICRDPTWVLGGFGEAIVAPPGALHPIPDGLPAAGAAMAEPLAAAVHAVARSSGAPGPAGVVGGGPMGLMLARLLVLAGREVTVADPHPERREQARSLGASAAERLDGIPLVFEAVGRPDGWRAALEAAAPGGAVVLVGGCPGGSRVELPADALHYDELDVRGAFHHSPAEVDHALGLLASGDVPWAAFAGEPLALEHLGAALAQAAGGGGRARKLLVDPRLPPA